jgi:colicin import membrane protein
VFDPDTNLRILSETDERQNDDRLRQAAFSRAVLKARQEKRDIEERRRQEEEARRETIRKFTDTAAQAKKVADRKAAHARELMGSGAAQAKKVADRKAAQARGLMGSGAAQAMKLAAQARELADRKAAQARELADRNAAQARELADRKAAQARGLMGSGAAQASGLMSSVGDLARQRTPPLIDLLNDAAADDTHMPKVG